jgi:hypothetical protein
MDIKRKTCDIRTWEKYIFLDISSTNIDTFVPSLYQCVGTRRIEAFFDCCLSHLLLSQSQQGDMVGHHLRLSHVLERISRLSCEPLYATNTPHRKEKIFIYEYPLHLVLLPTKNAQENAAPQ